MPEPSTVVHALRADRGDAGERLDRVLCRHLAGRDVSRSQIQGWIAAGRVRVEGIATRKAALRVAIGQSIEVDLPLEPARLAAAPEDRPLAVVHEDEHLLVIDKPPGWVVHPVGARRDGTLYNALLHYARGWPEGSRPSLVSRLDRDTSGLLLVAKRGEVHAGLARVLRRLRACKDYLALAYGAPPADRGKIDLRLRRDLTDPRKMISSRTEGLECSTIYERLGGAEGVTLLRCRLRSGRMHQIRVHLKAAGMPIVGDPLYGEPRWKGVRPDELAAACRGFQRQALHAWRLAFDHPVTGEWMELEVPPPADLAGLLRAAGLEVPEVRE